MNEHDTPPNGVAIIGLAARLPGAADLGAFWAHLRDGVESIRSFSDEELAAAGVPAPLLADPRYVRAKGVLDGVDLFDADFFGFTPREAEVMDPQHRLLLECAWEALENAGYGGATAGRRIAVFAGANFNSYLMANLLPNRELVERVGSLQTLLLNNHDFLSTRISYKLDLRGPSLLVQTACSTALTAVHLACQSLLGGECDMALAGGASLSFPQVAGYLHQEGGVMSPDGHCRAFDERAAGAVEGEGAGLVVLKRLADALADGDTVLAVVRGSAANNDGSGKVGFTAPSVEGQAEVIAEALAMAGVDPGTVGYVEAHGSGTPLGDPIEIEALTQAFRAGEPDPGTGRRGYCAVGSVKTNVGHLNSAAGIAGLVKAALALRHGEIPPSLGFTRPNPQIDFASSPFYVPAALTPWPRGATPRRAGLSSFGLGGTNVHLVLEEAPAPALEPPAPARPAELLLLSARTPAALDAATARLGSHLASPEGKLEIADVAYTLAAGRKTFPYRRALVAASREDAAAALVAGDPARLLQHPGPALAGRAVAFLFPGLGDHYVDMGRGLYDTEPVFRREVDHAAELLRQRLGEDVREAIFAGAGSAAGSAPDLRALLRRGEAAADPALQNLSRTELAQPALFVIEHALARLLARWGIQPTAMIGYSIGEYVAACLSGVLTLEGAITLVAGRARLIADLPPGAMLAIPLAEERVRPLIEKVAQDVDGGFALSLAAINGPHLSVAAGTPEAVAELERRLAAAGGATCLRLHATHAFHSAQMTPALEPLLALARSVPLSPPRIPYLSNVTGDWITATEATDPAYWGRHMAGTVRFAPGLARLLAGPERALLEVGPGDTLGTLARQHPGADARQPVVATLRRAGEGRADGAALLEAVGKLWTAGVGLDAETLFQPEEGGRRRRVPLPTYPFERRRYWIDPPSAPATAGAASLAPPAAFPADAEPGNRPRVADWFYLPAWRETPPVGAGRALALPGDAATSYWLVFLDAGHESGGLGRRLAARLTELGRRVYTVVPGESFRDLGEGAFALPPAGREGYEALLAELRRAGAGEPAGAVHLWTVGSRMGLAHLKGAADGRQRFEALQELGLLSLLRLAEVLGLRADGPPIRLLAVTSGAQAVLGGEGLDPGRAAILGACKVIPQELPRLACRAADVVLSTPATPGSAAEERETEHLVERLLAELAAPFVTGDPAVALRGRRRFLRVWEPMPMPADPDLPRLLKPGGAYVVTVAEHGIGPMLAEALRTTLNARLALIYPPRVPLGARLEALVESGHGEVLALCADLASGAAVGEALEAARGRFGAVDGIFHAADSFSGGVLQLKRRETLTAVFGPQVEGALALLEALAQMPGVDGGSPAPFVLLAGSTATATGGFGQVDHAAAGAVLGALAEQHAVAWEGPLGPLVVAVDWDPYQWGSWLAGGLVGAPSLGVDMAENLARFEVPPARSLEALERLLAAGLPRVVVSAQDLATAIAESDAVHAKELLAGIAHPAAGSHARPEGPYVAPATATERALAGIWGELFGIEQVGARDDFLALGGHSLLAIQLLTQVREGLGIELPVSALFEHPTIAELAAVVDAERGEAAAAEEEDLDALLAEVEALSADEVARLLESERAAVGAGR